MGLITKDKPINPPDMVAHHDDLPHAPAHKETAESKLRVGPSCFDFLYHHQCLASSAAAAFDHAYLSGDTISLLPADSIIRTGCNSSKLSQVMKAVLFSPVRAAHVHRFSTAG